MPEQTRATRAPHAPSTSRAAARLAATVVAAVVATGLAAAAPPAGAVENPILGDGTYYSADPAPLVAGDTLYIFAGRDEAGPTTNDFVMREWQAFSTTDVSADFSSDAWQHHPALMRPETVFDWAAAGRAYAGQVVEGADGRYYWYVPVVEQASTAADTFAIGVAVADDPLGPYTDAIGAPLVSQTILNNTIQNIDPTVLVDDDGQVYMWWGTFGQLRMIRLAADMVTLQGDVQTITGLPGFFEAPWVFRRGGYYYLAYAGNNAGPTSECTPATYHACIAYATATSPAGPWTYRGVILPPVSSTTSHPGIVEFDGQWYLTYHTADAVGGTHFRRSVAIDKVEWDDSVTPARILPVTTTPVRGTDFTPRENVAWAATASVSNQPVPTQYWIKALNDEKIPANPLPPDMWGTWSGTRPAQQWAQYTWDAPVRIDGAQIQFWRDQAPGIGTGVSNPAAWRLQYRDAGTGAWVDVPNPSGYPTTHDVLHTVTFDPVTTTQLRATFDGSPSTTTPTTYAAVAVTEWAVLGAPVESVAPVGVGTWVGRDAPPRLRASVEVTYPGGVVLDVPAWWPELDPAMLSTPGEHDVTGLLLGSGAPLTATVTVAETSPWWANQALTAAASASVTGAGNAVGAVQDDVVPATVTDPAQVWTATPQVGEQWVEYAWDAPVRLSRSELTFHADVTDPAAAGVAVPASWRLQYWDGAWTDVPTPSGYGTAADAANVTEFTPVTTTRLRAVVQAQGTATGQASVGVREWRVLGEAPDVAAPVVMLQASGAVGAAGWYTSPVTVAVVATDDRDSRFTITTRLDDAAPVEVTGAADASVAVATEGVHAVAAQVTDSWGNVGEASLDVPVDSTRPIVTAVVDPAARTVTLTAEDALSGVEGIAYAVDDLAAWAPYTGAVVLDGQRHVVHYRAVDVAGNASVTGSVTVPIDPAAPLVGNVAEHATPTASYTAPWNVVGAVKDGAGVNTGGAQSAVWGTWTGAEPTTRWLQYEWDRPVTIERSELMFWHDAEQGSGVGVAVPQSWTIQYWDTVTGAWADLQGVSGYPTASSGYNETTFDPVITTRLRATFTLSPNPAGTARSAVAVSEWRVHSVPLDELDVTAPVVTGSVDGRVVTVAAGDAGSGVASVEYRLGADGAWLPYAEAVTVDGSDAVTVWFRATDVAGNTSDVGSVQVPAVVEPVSFSDVPVSHPFFDEITWLASAGIARGYADGTFRGSGSVNRDAMAAFLFRLVTGERSAPACTSAPFVDVSTAHPFCGEIAWLKAQGIAGGYADGTYRPGAPVARDAMAAFIYRTVTGAGIDEVAVKPATRPFTDVATTHPFAGEIAWLKAQGLAAGWPDGTFRPSVSIERQAMAAFLYRLVNETDLMPTGGATSLPSLDPRSPRAA